MPPCSPRGCRPCPKFAAFTPKGLIKMTIYGVMPAGDKVYTKKETAVSRRFYDDLIHT